MSGGPFTRTPALYTEIRNITPDDTGRRVRVMGFVVDLHNDSVFILSDDTGRISVLSEILPSLQAFVRVIGLIAISKEGQPLIRAEIIQNLATLDRQLYKRATKIVAAVPSGRSQ
jgi:hypothetical protein